MSRSCRRRAAAPCGSARAGSPQAHRQHRERGGRRERHERCVAHGHRHAGQQARRSHEKRDAGRQRRDRGRDRPADLHARGLLLAHDDHRVDREADRVRDAQERAAAEHEQLVRGVQRLPGLELAPAAAHLNAEQADAVRAGRVPAVRDHRPAARDAGDEEQDAAPVHPPRVSGQVRLRAREQRAAALLDLREDLQASRLDLLLPRLARAARTDDRVVLRVADRPGARGLDGDRLATDVDGRDLAVVRRGDAVDAGVAALGGRVEVLLELLVGIGLERAELGLLVERARRGKRCRRTFGGERDVRRLDVEHEAVLRQRADMLAGRQHEQRLVLLREVLAVAAARDVTVEIEVRVDEQVRPRRGEHLRDELGVGAHVRGRGPRARAAGSGTAARGAREIEPGRRAPSARASRTASTRRKSSG